MIKGFQMPTVRVWEVNHKQNFEMGSYWFHAKPILSDTLFRNKRVVLFGFPGAFHLTQGRRALPQIDSIYDEMLECEIDEVYVTSVNDAWTMREWFKKENVTKPYPFADGNGDFARQIGMLNDLTSVGAGYRSWRYAMVIENGAVEWILQESHRADKMKIDPYEFVHPEEVLNYLIGAKVQREIERSNISENCHSPYDVDKLMSLDDDI